MDISELSKILNVIYDNKTGQVMITVEILDPVWKQKFLRKFDKLNVKLIVEDNDANL